jgi:hypothetical protein
MSIEAVGNIAGSGPDVIGAVLAVSEAMRAGKGFVFNTCAFEIETPTSGGADSGRPSSAASKTNSGSSPSAAGPAGSANSTPTVRQGPSIFRITVGSAGQGGPTDAAQLGLRQITFPERTIGVVELRQLDPAFDSSFDAVVLEIVATVAGPESALLVLRGFANPGGKGYAHFSAAIHVRLGAGKHFATKVLFVSQAPPPQSGTGIFGKTVFVNDRGTEVRVQMEMTPLF